MKGKNEKRRQQGSSSVEFALVLPILLLILFSIIEYGWLFTWQIALTNAVSEGARAAISTDDEDEARNYATQAVREAFWLRDLQEDAVTTEIIDDENPRRIVVRVPELEYRPLTGFIPSNLIPERLAATSVMVFP